jgi:hypothetical protein
MSNSKPRTLLISIDYGGSSVKVIGGTALDDFQAFALEPHIIKVSESACSGYRYKAADIPEAGEAKNCLLSAFVGVGDQYFAVGDLARRVFHAANALKPLKIENAIPKTLAAIWVLSQMYGTTASLSIALCCFLPPGEFQDASRFEFELAQALSNFDTPTGRMKVKLAKFQCWPEGYGLVKRHLANRHQILSGRTVGLVMIGHRNISTFEFTNGDIEKYRSSGLGFTKLVDWVMQKTSGYDPNTLVEAIAKYCISQEDEHLKSILRRSGEVERGIELINLIAAIDAALDRYFCSVTAWLDEVISSEMQEVVVGGGTVNILGKRIVFYLNKRVPEMKDKAGTPAVFMHGSFSEESYPPVITELNMDVRFADNWCLWKYQLSALLSSK